VGRGEKRETGGDEGGSPLQVHQPTWVQTRVLLREWKYSVSGWMGAVCVDSEPVWCAPSRKRVVVRSMIERARMHETNTLHTRTRVCESRSSRSTHTNQCLHSSCIRTCTCRHIAAHAPARTCTQHSRTRAHRTCGGAAS